MFTIFEIAEPFGDLGALVIGLGILGIFGYFLIWYGKEFIVTILEFPSNPKRGLGSLIILLMVPATFYIIDRTGSVLVGLGAFFIMLVTGGLMSVRDKGDQSSS